MLKQTNAESERLRFAVLQPGARMHYAVPAILAQAGLLQKLYTDFYAGEGIVFKAIRTVPSEWRPAPLLRLLGREVPCIVNRKSIKQCGMPALAAMALSQLTRGMVSLSTDKCVIASALSDAFGGANCIYTVLVNSDLDLIRLARERGIRVVHEVMLSPDVGLWLRQERDLFPGIEDQDPLSEVEGGRLLDSKKYQLADLILVPSEFARNAVLQLGADEGRVKIVPYGIHRSWLQTIPEPQPGRVLFVGGVGLRKGVHYLAEAARILRQRRVKCEVRVVGPAIGTILSKSIFEGPSYVGQVPRSRVRSEFLSADVFVLPSIAEGSATVTYEALACGVPVITTPNAGSTVRDGVDGYIVPIRDPVTLADRIEAIVTDRSLRSRLSIGAKERARHYTIECYSSRLIEELMQLRSGHK